MMFVLKKFKFGDKNQKWIQILMKKLESCVISGSKIKPYFKVERRTRKGDQISAYLFIVALEVVFTLIKTNTDIKGLQFFSHTFCQKWG